MDLKVYRLYGLFFILSLFLIILVLFQSEKIDIWNLHTSPPKVIQKVCQKEYSRKRKRVIYPKSLMNAQKEIDAILVSHSITFDLNQSKVTLNKILTILKHLEEDAILSIETHTDTKGSRKENLQRSQEYANILKNYFRERCSLPLIVAVGYGEEIPLPKKSKRNSSRIEFKLKRIQ